MSKVDVLCEQCKITQKNSEKFENIISELEESLCIDEFNDVQDLKVEICDNKTSSELHSVKIKFVVDSELWLENRSYADKFLNTVAEAKYISFRNLGMVCDSMKLMIEIDFPIIMD